MNFLSGLPHIAKIRGNRIRVLLHGKLIHCFNNQQTVIELTQQDIRKTLGGTSRPIVFLASPFIHTFIHETIQLSKKELEKADQQLLGFKTPAASYINITSLKLNEKKSITIHSHLTHEGAELLKELQREKIRLTWYPAILSVVTNLYQDGIESLTDKEKLRIYLADELLQIQKQGGMIRFEHLNYLHSHLTFEEKKRTIERIIDKEGSKAEFSALVFNHHPSSASDSIKHPADHILIAPRKGRHVKSVTRSVKKRPLALQYLLRQNSLLGLVTAVIVTWAFLINNHADSINQKRLGLQHSISILQQHSDRLNQIAKLEREHFRFISMMQAAQSLKIQPALFLKNLDQILPDSVWLSHVTIQDHHIEMELLDRTETELSAFMDRLGKQCGETNLKKNEFITLNKIPLRKYSVEISHLNPKTLYEKLD
ncbi:MAG: hypothetical protein HOK67_25685 [Deltaproteobacteria bacterium]|nr:hypothetical protein [Deltaproteobacteria bacterium]